MQRIKDTGAIEARLLELAHTTEMTINAASLAYFAPCSVEDAAKVLEALAARDVLAMNVTDDGAIIYELRGRQRIRRTAPPVAIVHRQTPSGPSALLAAFLSFWLPGAGHLYSGRVTAAVVWFLVVGAGYVLILPGLVLHLFCIVSSASAAAAERHRLSATPLQLAA